MNQDILTVIEQNMRQCISYKAQANDVITSAYSLLIKGTQYICATSNKMLTIRAPITFISNSHRDTILVFVEILFPSKYPFVPPEVTPIGKLVPKLLYMKKGKVEVETIKNWAKLNTPSEFKLQKILTELSTVFAIYGEPTSEYIVATPVLSQIKKPNSSMIAYSIPPQNSTIQQTDPKEIIIEQLLYKASNYKFIETGIESIARVEQYTTTLMNKATGYENYTREINAQCAQMDDSIVSIKSAIDAWNDKSSENWSKGLGLDDESIHIMKWVCFLRSTTLYNNFLKKLLETDKLKIDDYLKEIRQHSFKMFRKMVLIKKICGSK